MRLRLPLGEAPGTVPWPLDWRRARARVTRSFSSLLFQGLLRRSKAPSRTASMAVSRVPNPDSRIVSTPSGLASFNRSRPSFFASILMSESSKSKGSPCSSAMALSGFVALATSSPIVPRSSSRNSQVSLLSSTTSTRAMITPLDTCSLRLAFLESQAYPPEYSQEDIHESDCAAGCARSPRVPVRPGGRPHYHHDWHRQGPRG